MIAIHLAAHALGSLQPLNSDAICAKLWCALRKEFPQALACTLMPDHIHLILSCNSARTEVRARRRLAIQLRALARTCGAGPLWQPLSPGHSIPDRFHLKRQIRYVHRNPCRANLTQDPVTWLWTTHRDVLGMAYPAWITADRMAQVFGESPHRFRERFHYYVSADQPTPRGTPMPQIQAGVLGQASSDPLRNAITVATRGQKGAEVLLFALLQSQPEQSRSSRALARLLKVPRTTFQRKAKQGSKQLTPEIRTAVALCLKSEAKSGSPRPK